MLTNTYPRTVAGYYNAVDYLIANNQLDDTETEAYFKFPHCSQMVIAHTISKANKLRAEAHRKALVIN